MGRLRIPLLPAWIRWGLVVGLAAVIAAYSVIPVPPGVREFGPFGLLPLGQYVHLVAYAGLAGVLVYALADSRWEEPTVLAVAFVVAIGYGLGMELVQLTIRYRQFQLIDLVFNAVGTAVAVAVWRMVLKRARFYRVESSGTDG